MRFVILKAVAGDGATARLGRLALPKRQPVDTPNFFAMTSRGVVPHLTPDTIARYGQFPGSYHALEDCECRLPPEHLCSGPRKLTGGAQWLRRGRRV